MNTRYGLSDTTWMCGLYHPNWRGFVISCALRAFMPFPLQDTCYWGIFCPLFPRAPRLSVVKTVVRPLFERIPGVALLVEKRIEFFLPHPKICKWSALWSTALHCICRQPVSILSVTQTVVKIIARRISFCDAVDKEKGFENLAVILNPACNPVRI